MTKQDSESTIPIRAPHSAAWISMLVCYLILAFWIAAGLYFGIAGWTKIQLDTLAEAAMKAPEDKVTYTMGCEEECEPIEVEFRSMADLMVFLEQERVYRSIFCWVYTMPSPLPFVLSSLAFGALGNTAALLRMALTKNNLPGISVLLISPLSGALIALMLLGVSYIVPAMLTVDGATLRPVALLFISLFAGAFSDHIYKWLQAFVDKIFPLSKNEEDKNEQSTIDQ